MSMQGHSMQCHEVHELVAGWLDDELSPGQAELMAQHLERCEACAELVQTLSRQELSPPPAPDTASPGFWEPLEDRLGQELEAVLAERTAEPPAPPPWHRELRLRPVQALLYAAVLLLAMGFAGLQSWRASTTAEELAELQSELDRFERIHAQPAQALPLEAYPVAVFPTAGHTPHRGSL